MSSRFMSADDKYHTDAVADSENLVGGAFSNNRARKFWSRPLTRNHALIIKIETIQQQKTEWKSTFYPYKQVFLVRFCSQIHERLSFLG